MNENLESKANGVEKDLGGKKDYGDIVKALAADLKVQKAPRVLKLADITRWDREEFRVAMWARRRRERIDEKSRQFREMMAARPVNYESLPLRRRPIRRVHRSEAAKARRRGE